MARVTAGRLTRPRPPTVYDVALVAGVSHATVSRAVNGLDGMTAETRRRVLEIVADLGYEPNTSARGLAGRSPAQLAAVLVGTGSPMRAAELLDRLTRAAGRRGYALTMVTVDPADERSVAAAAERLGEPGLEGMVFLIDDGPEARHLAGRLAGSRSVHLPVSGGQAAVVLAVGHLRALGHRAIVHIPSGAADEGLRLARQGGLPADCTALVAPSASYALGFTRGLRRRGVRVPEDFSIVSLEDRMDAAHFAPPLTAISTDGVGSAEAAVDALLREMDSGESPLPLAVTPRLELRASTAPPARQPIAR